MGVVFVAVVPGWGTGTIHEIVNQTGRSGMRLLGNSGEWTFAERLTFERYCAGKDQHEGEERTC
jgi:hypothetical protein